MAGEKHSFSMSEIRGIGLVAFALIALVYYYSWWFITDNSSNWLAVTFSLALAYSLIQLVGNWILYLATHYRSTNCLPLTTQEFTIDIFITACNESHALVEKALLAACALPEEKQIWLLDDGNDPALARLTTGLGVGYLTRPDRRHAKAGNINAALSRTTGDIVVIFDIDHTPKPDFLAKSLGCFLNPDVGFVQVMLTFGNRDESWISSATADTSLDFYNPTSIGADGMRSTTLIGSNALIRRKALDSIQGYQPGLAEDLATSIALHAVGWLSVYIAEPLAPGIAPPDLTSWFTQQLKWSRGVFELLLTDFPRYFRKLQPGHRVMYAVRMTYYWVGLFSAVHLLLTIGTLWRGSAAALSSYEQYLEHLAPLIGMTLILRQLALRRWVHPSIKDVRVQWKPTVLVFATWPIYTLSWFMAIFRVPLRFQPTPKTAGWLHPAWVLPQLISAALLLIGLIYTIVTIKTFYVLVFGFALAQMAAQLFLVNDWLRPLARQYSSTTPSSLSLQTLSEPLSDTSASIEDSVGIQP
jgi:cellulose synthase/poly-beta-1,6-N-acetylglucosamine synthase-like glycosyltransferase